MTDALKPYDNALKYAFSQSFGGAAKDWDVGAERPDATGAAVRDFTNGKTGVTLEVSGTLEAEFAKFSGKRTDAAAAPDESVNLSVPASWANMPLPK